MRPVHRAFTLIELLAVIAIISILTAILFPVFAAAKQDAKKASCASNLKQIGVALQLYEVDSDNYMPDRRDLKNSLPGGYHPWTTWPPSDPRAGWAATLLQPYVRSYDIWACPSIANSPLGSAVQVLQKTDDLKGASNYWMWRFDRITNPVTIDDFWGKTEDQAILDLDKDDDPKIGQPVGTSDVELAVDPYFPATIPTTPPALKGRTAHFNGRNRVMLDTHVKFLPDARTPGF